MTAPSQESTTLVWLAKFGWNWRRSDEESCFVECCFTSTRLKHWLPSEMWDSNYSVTHHMCQTWLQVTCITSYTEGIHKRMQISWLQDRYLHDKWLAERARSTILLQWNPSFGGMVDHVHFSCRRQCWKVTKYNMYTHLVFNCVSLRTFITTLIHVLVNVLLLDFMCHIVMVIMMHVAIRFGS